MNLEAQIKDIENSSRIVANIQNLIVDCDIKGNMATAVAEIQAFLGAFQKNLSDGLTDLRFEQKRQASAKHSPTEVVDNQVAS